MHPLDRMLIKESMDFIQKINDPEYMLFGKLKEDLYHFVISKYNDATIKDRLTAYKYSILIEKMRKLCSNSLRNLAEYKYMPATERLIYHYLSPEIEIASVLSSKIRSTYEKKEIAEITKVIKSECDVIEGKLRNIKEKTWEIDSNDTYRERLKDFYSEEDIEERIVLRNRLKTSLVESQEARENLRRAVEQVDKELVEDYWPRIEKKEGKIIIDDEHFIVDKKGTSRK